MQIFFFLSSRLNQIITNYKNKSTGVLSPITIMLGWSGNLARLFTLLVDLGFEDPQIIVSNFIFFVFNFTPFVQYLIYKGQKPIETGKDQEKSATKEEKEENPESEKVVSLKKTKRKEEQTKSEETSDQVVTRRKKTKKRED